MTPRTVFNRTLSPRRSFATTSLPVADLKAVKNAAGVTLNDVVLATVAGALDRFFESRGEALSKPLIASVPMAVATPGGAPREAGNRVANLFTSLCNDVRDPLERLQKIQRGHRAVERRAAPTRGRDPARLVGGRPRGALPLGPRRLLAVRVWRTCCRRRPNLIVSNVRGPDHPLYVAGARLRTIYSVGPAIEGIGLNITGWSYCGDLAVALIADADAIPDPHIITNALRPALAELRQATL